ncbi:Lipopolysaccharide assembly protein B [Zhongshania aliphaticivorans]|uniref:Lipopolysaccharide assembly protein B n=1 Tax=Zhongshania aliphaticivorans TaxID=1470434 RepID=A0A5S9NCA2_9GAMM|nr:lipopolysaccharide assembly protein LapB [Zhongshania aliphaticivorans]CAA0078228.1 Lipopolysaccharide assembly protein B [Zhongshania aliphaticivorans]CAA0086843.1 Lipopolysaccharide assembly protein B [Zhongshania aliphaticivorans]
MSEEIVQFFIILVAVASGWLLGYWYRPKQKGSVTDDTASSYYKGLNYLLSEQAGAAVMTVINELPVNIETLPTHLALGNLMRSKGEVEGAIRIHQNLLSRPSLPKDKLYQVHLELARDYISAGLFDRAERLLRDVVDESTLYRSEALTHLQNIYQSEKDWDQAIAVARLRLPQKHWLKKQAVATAADRAVECSLSHYYCEKAQRLVYSRDFKLASKELQDARYFDNQNVRSLLLSAHIAIQEKKPQLALDLLQSILENQPAYASEVLPLFREAFTHLGNRTQYLHALRRIVEKVNCTAFIIECADVIAECDGSEAAERYLHEASMQRPTTGLLAAVLERSPNELSSTVLTQQFLQQLKAERPSYRCRHCGFSGQKLHWLCPSCEQWGTIAPIRGIQGD